MPPRIALSLAAPTEVHAVVNTGRWPHSGPAARAGWYSSPVLLDLAKVSEVDFLSAASDAPAHARYEGLLLDGLVVTQELGFWPWGASPVRSSRATCRVSDADGRLDGLALSDIRGAEVSVRLGSRGGSVAASTPVARFVVDRVEVVSDLQKQLTLDDAHGALDEPLARGVFMPNVPTLAWRTVPVVIGAVASVPALSANSDGTVRFLCDAPLAHVADVLDRGDAMESGTFELSPDGQQLLMQYPPVAPVVTDVSSIGPGMQPATLVQALREIFRRAGESAWSAADAAAIDSTSGYAGIGYYTADTTTARDALAAILPSYGAWIWEDADGVLRFARIVAPESVAPTFALAAADMAGDLVVTPDLAPSLSRRMAFRPNAQALGAGDLVTDLEDVPPARRVELTALWRGQVYAAGQLAPCYRHAESADPIMSVLWRREDAQAEIDRVVAMYAMPRLHAQVRITDPEIAVPAPGAVGTITYPRYGLDAGRPMLVRARTRNFATGETTLTLWG